MKNQHKKRIDAAALEYKRGIDSHLRVSFKHQRVGSWLKNHSKHINKEEEERNSKIIKNEIIYKRGTLIKVDFGINIGTEFSGSHFAIVLNRKDTKNSSNLTVVPLTSKNSKSVLIGSDVFTLISEKMKESSDDVNSVINELTVLEKEISRIIGDANEEPMLIKEKIIERFKAVNEGSKYSDLMNYFYGVSDIDKSLDDNIVNWKNEKKRLIEYYYTQKEKYDKVEEHYKACSINSYAKIDSITTISKNRIKSRINEYDPMGVVRISQSALKTIQDEFRAMYI